MMTNAELCDALMRVDTEEAVVSLLTTAGYWDDPNAWRLLGDNESNYSPIGNQQSDAVAALVEKIVNSVDALLLNAAGEAGITPEAPEAPTSIREGIATFFEGKANPRPDRDGRIVDWDQRKVTEQAKRLTLAVTSDQPGTKVLSVTVADNGEGQAPDDFPDTFLSLEKGNKLRVHFVQGKFNMGGTGALQFCGRDHQLQLIISRRNPMLVQGRSAREGEWGFTVVRREKPAGAVRSSVYKYLAPIGSASAPGLGAVLSFVAETWPLLPDEGEKRPAAYTREVSHGSLVKMYDYRLQGSRSNIITSGGGLLSRVDAALPELALPLRMYECRSGYRGHSGSFSTNVTGIINRLERNKADNLEVDDPIAGVISLNGRQLKVRTFVFKPGKAENYRTARQAVLLTVNGQTQATFGNEFLRSKRVGLSYLADSMLVVVDCTDIDGSMREDLFMNSRDRLRDGEHATALRTELEYLLKNDTALKELKNRRREQELADKLSDDKPLAEVLNRLLNTNPTLSRLFLQGLNLSAPFPPASGGSGNGTASTFHGKRFPTYFRFKGKPDGHELTRDVHLGSRTQIALETDAEDAYFGRAEEPGAWDVVVEHNGQVLPEARWTTRGPRSGTAQVSLAELPSDALVDDEIKLTIRITDDSRIDAFTNSAVLKVKPAQKPGPSGPNDGSGSRNAGKGSGGGQSALALPQIVKVRQEDYGQHEGFTDLTALQIKLAETTDTGSDAYDFYINVDNRYLKIAEKESRQDPKLLEARFTYSMVILGLALIQDREVAGGDVAAPEDGAEGDGDQDVETLVARATAALAPVVLPLIDAMAAMSEDDIAEDE